MSGLHIVLGSFAGVAVGVLVTILRVWLMNRVDCLSCTTWANPRRLPLDRPETDWTAVPLAVPPSAEVLEAERLAGGRGRSSFESRRSAR